MSRRKRGEKRRRKWGARGMDRGRDEERGRDGERERVPAHCRYIVLPQETPTGTVG